jgi:peroxiredoxin
MVRTESTMLELGTAAPSFSLKDTDGSTVTPGDFAGKPLMVAFICNHCPFVIHLADHLAEFAKTYQTKGLSMVAISSNDISTHPDDSPEKMVEERASRGYTFPYLYDGTQKVAKAYHAACTPDFFLFDANHALVYRGQYDSSRPRQDPAEAPTGADLAAAVEAVLAGTPVAADQTPSMGCNIKWIAGAEPDYFKS